jgi:transcriptional regulator with XRE-family HTH domain
MAELDLGDIARFVRDACLALGWSQRELSRRSGVPQTAISRVSRGRLAALDLDQLARIAAATGARMRFVVDAPFLGDRARQRDRVHARCIGYVAVRLRAAGWQVATEVEIQGVRGPGWIDLLAFDPRTGRLLVIEIKTEIDDLGRIQRTLGWYARQSRMAARRLGWRPTDVAPVLLLLATQAVDARLRGNRDLVRVAFPADAAEVRGWISRSTSSAVRPALAMVDPISRSSTWLRGSVLDRRNRASPHADYAAVARRLAR